MSTYFALTIGPIYETISSARTTREMWASSYMFSYIIKHLVEDLKNEGMDILLPCPDFVHTRNYVGAGIYPDRIIAKSNCTQENVHKIIDEILKRFAENIMHHLDKKNHLISHSFSVNGSASQQDGILDYLQRYIRVYYICKELDENKDNIINSLYPFLDSLELTPRVLQTENFPETTYIRLLENSFSKAHIRISPLRLFTDLVNSSFLIDDGLGTAEERRRLVLPPKRNFSTLNEIATVELKQINPDSYKEFEDAVQDEINETWQVEIEKDRISSVEGKTEFDNIQILRNKFGDKFKTYHNYMAIVHADGDNVGKIIKSMTNVRDSQNNIVNQEVALKAFSKILTNYSIDATKLIADYGATPVYIGGDDLFFFAPVASLKKSTNQWMNIFDLISELDILFNSKIRDQTEYQYGLPADKQPSLSYGISITYRKFPLYEARNISYFLMKYTAKEKMKRNAIGITLLKSSGHDISFEISKKQPEVFIKFLTLIQSRINTKENFINSITYKLASLKEILIQISGNQDRLRSFFKNNFNENYNANKTFYEALEDFILNMSVQNLPATLLSEDNYSLLYGTLRYIHFLRSNEKE